jgi:hypothetical protein
MDHSISTVNQTSISFVEEAKAHGVKALNVVVPNVSEFIPQIPLLTHRIYADCSIDGRGTGEWRKISVNIPASIRVSIKNKVVYKFEKNGVSSASCSASSIKGTSLSLVIHTNTRTEPTRSACIRLDRALCYTCGEDPTRRGHSQRREGLLFCNGP